MQALRTRAACAARQTRSAVLRSSRSYASDSHGHAAPQVEEKLGAAFYVFAGAIPLSFIGYTLTKRGPNGEPSSMTKWLETFDYFNEWETRNTIRTNMMDQAAHDKHLFYNSGRNLHIELKSPEVFFSAGSPSNIPAGHHANLDHVKEHYRKAYEEEEERKLAALKKKAEQS